MVVVDSHQHFWDPAVTEFTWMTDAHAPIRRRFGPEDLGPLLAANGVDATVLVQTWHSVDETCDFLATASKVEFIAGVVGWIDLTDPAVDRTLDELLRRVDGRYLVSIRHLVHDEPDPEWLLRDDVRRGLTALDRRGLAYDLLLKVRNSRGAADSWRFSWPALRRRPHRQAEHRGERNVAVVRTDARVQDASQSRLVQAVGNARGSRLEVVDAGAAKAIRRSRP